MVTVEIRFDHDTVKVRRFGSGGFNHWSEVVPGDDDRLTGRSYDEIRSLGEGVWGFTDVAEANGLTPAPSMA